MKRFVTLVSAVLLTATASAQTASEDSEVAPLPQEQPNDTQLDDSERDEQPTRTGTAAASGTTGTTSGTSSSGTTASGTSSGTTSSGTTSSSSSATTGTTATSRTSGTGSGTRTTEPETTGPDTTPPAPVHLANEDDDEEEEEDEDSWGVFFIEAQAGYSFANLVQFDASNFIPEAEEVSGSGFFGGAALGFRIYFLTLGVRATIASYFGFEIGTAGLDIALHLPIPFISPYVRVGIGYAWMGDADWDEPGLSSTDVNGLAADVGLGLNIKLARIISLGAGFDAAFLNLGRQKISGAGSISEINLEESGDAVGLQLRIHAHVTLHI